MHRVPAGTLIRRLSMSAGKIRMRTWLVGFALLASAVVLVRQVISVSTDSAIAGDQDLAPKHYASQNLGRLRESMASTHKSVKGKKFARGSGSHTAASAFSGTSVALNASVVAAGQVEDNQPLSPEEIAKLKEEDIQERFGVIQRKGKWIPTIGGGSNQVFITTGMLPLGRVGDPYEVRFNAESGVPPYHWNILADELPPSFSFNGSSGRLAGTPSDPSNTSFFLEVTDSQGAMDVAEYVLIVQPAQELTILTASLPAAYPGNDYRFQLQAVGGIPPYAWSATGDIEAIGLFTLDPATGYLSGQIAATVAVSDIPLVIRLADSQRQVSKDFVFHVRAMVSILDIPLSLLQEATPFEYAFQAAGGLEPYIWGCDGNLPLGLTLDETGILSGTPTESGLYDVRVWVVDSFDQLDDALCTLEVLPSLPDAVSDFHARLSRNSVALKWLLPACDEPLAVTVVRSTDGPPRSASDGRIIYQGTDLSYLDRDVGAGTHYYAAFLQVDDLPTTADQAPVLTVRLPPATDPFADKIESKRLLHPSAFGSNRLPVVVLGAPSGKGLAWGSTDVLSLGAAVNGDGGVSAPYGGEITLAFTDNLVWDGPGDDFTVFENVFYVHDAQGVPNPETRFMEPAIVSVSQDGMAWRTFECDFSPRYYPDSGKLNLRHPYCYNSGFAGVNPVMSSGTDPDPTDPAVSGGDSFDISKVGFDWIRYVRIQSTGSRWLPDSDGDLIYHNEEMDAASRTSSTSGFDLDAITAIWMERVASSDPGGE